MPSMRVIGGFYSWSLRCGRRSNLLNGRVNVDFERLEINEIFLMGCSHVLFYLLSSSLPTKIPAEVSARLSKSRWEICGGDDKFEVTGRERSVLEPLPMLAVDRSRMCPAHPYSTPIPSPDWPSRYFTGGRIGQIIAEAVLTGEMKCKGVL
jgi:hypothetical protein